MSDSQLSNLSSEDFSKMLDKLEDLNKKMKMNLDLSIHRDHVIEESGSHQDIIIAFTGIVDSKLKDSVEKFKEEVIKIVPGGESNVKFDITFEEPKKVLSLKDEHEAHSKLEEYHNKMKGELKGIDKASIRLTSRRTYSPKEGEKFSGDLYISGNCPSDLKHNFMKYYKEVAKPLPPDFHRHNRATLRNEPSRPHISCAICSTSMDEKESYFTCLTCDRDMKTDIAFCDSCVNKEQELANFKHPHTLILVLKKNELRSQPTKKFVTSDAVQTKEQPSSTQITPYSYTRSLFPELDLFTRTFDPLTQRFRDFERIADRIEREMNRGFWRGPNFDDIAFPFGSEFI